ncbi:MAG: hypothetical protein II329_02095 [Clostridia bacterium]|nr:hypothetical protein [Clostridia bacterium]
MGKRLNHNFLEIYKELDRDCCEKFGVTSGGVTEYINRLNNARFAPDRDDVLPRLVRYRNIRNKFAHDVGSIRKSDEISKADIKWVRGFNRDLVKKRDPISTYLKKARRYARRRKIYRIFFVFFLLLIASLAVALYFALSK